MTPAYMPLNEPDQMVARGKELKCSSLTGTDERYAGWRKTNPNTWKRAGRTGYRAEGRLVGEDRSHARMD